MAARHEVDVFTLADDSRDMAYRDDLAAHCHGLTIAPVHAKMARLRALPFLVTRTPLTVPYFYSAQLQTEVQRALLKRSYDRIFVYCSAMAQYVGGVDDIPMVMDFVDVDSDKWLQYASFTRFPLSVVYRREARTLRDYERRISAKAACVIVSTCREAELLREIAPGAQVQVVPNGVNTNYFSPLAEPTAAKHPAIIFVGDMSYFPNQEAVGYFVGKVLPVVRESVPGTRFLIVGRNPGRKTLELGQQEGVEVTGFVPDVRAYLAQAQVAVAPFSIAAGIQNKILEAMAFGLPVVATSRTKQGLSPAVADMVDTGDTAKEMAAKIVLLLRDSQTAKLKGLEGRRRVSEDYRWDWALDQLMQLLENPSQTELLTPRSQLPRA